MAAATLYSSFTPTKGPDPDVGGFIHTAGIAALLIDLGIGVVIG